MAKDKDKDKTKDKDKAAKQDQGQEGCEDPDKVTLAWKFDEGQDLLPGR